MENILAYTYSHEVLAVFLGGITESFTHKAVPFLENWSFNTVSKISSLGNLPIFLSFANGSTLRKTTLEVLFQTSLFLSSLQLFLNFQGFIGCQWVNVVDGLAVTMQALFTNLEEGLSHRCFHINLNMVGQDFSAPRIFNNTILPVS